VSNPSPLTRTVTVKSVRANALAVKMHKRRRTETLTDQFGLEGATRIPRFNLSHDEGVWANTRLVSRCMFRGLW